SGRSAASGSKLLAVSNLYDGFDIYDVTTQLHVRTCSIPLTVNLPLPVLISSDESELITGSASGEVRTHDPVTGSVLQLLDHRGE
ncbi:hypothetical protein FKP32DRAFT_1572484, partial [Trametes sanguinea]